jgi:hypothetical protein
VCLIRAITTAIVAISSAGLLAQAQFQVGTKKSVSLTGINIAGADFGDQASSGCFRSGLFLSQTLVD